MIKVVKLTTGEEVIADCQLNGNDTTTFKGAVRLAMTAQGLAMVPWCPVAKDETVTIRNELIVFTAEIEDEVKNAYNERFGSGLVIPPQRIVT